MGISVHELEGPHLIFQPLHFLDSFIFSLPGGNNIVCTSGHLYQQCPNLGLNVSTDRRISIKVGNGFKCQTYPLQDTAINPLPRCWFLIFSCHINSVVTATVYPSGHFDYVLSLFESGALMIVISGYYLLLGICCHTFWGQKKY